MIVIRKPGVLASVQDLGRHGHRQLGICPGGALDVLALTLANARIAFTGDDFGATLDGVPLWPCWSVPVAAGQTLRLAGANASGTRKSGVRSWLAVAGGIDVPPVLGSRSTDLKAGFGGLQGRALRKGDRLPTGVSTLNAAQRERRPFGIRGPDWGPAEDDGAIALRVLPGPEFELFTLAAREQLWGERWRITPQSNRMGSRLEGAELKRKRSGDMLSSGVIPGTIQVPPSGQPIILMGDAQTTGGYPRIGVVIRADLWKLAQAPLNGRLRLVQVDQPQALAAWADQQRYLSQVAQGLAAAGWPAAS